MTADVMATANMDRNAIPCLPVAAFCCHQRVNASAVSWIPDLLRMLTGIIPLYALALNSAKFTGSYVAVFSLTGSRPEQNKRSLKLKFN